MKILAQNENFFIAFLDEIWPWEQFSVEKNRTLGTGFPESGIPDPEWHF